MTVSKLVKENKLEQSASGLWHLPGDDVRKNLPIQMVMMKKLMS